MTPEQSGQRVVAGTLGDFGEGMGWQVRYDEPVDLWYGISPCPHCHTPRPGDRGTVVTCPRVVVAHNQAGHDSTFVCLDCVLAAADPPAAPGEVERVVNVPFGGCYRTPCRRCGQPVELWYNGGELDSRECCGLSYALRCERVDLVVTDPARA